MEIGQEIVKSGAKLTVYSKPYNSKNKCVASARVRSPYQGLNRGMSKDFKPQRLLAIQDAVNLTWKKFIAFASSFPS